MKSISSHHKALKSLQFFFLSVLLISLPAEAKKNIGQYFAQRVIPSPREAFEQVEAMSQEEISQVTITDEIRDELRLDPEWQSLLREVRGNMMEFKWGARKFSESGWIWDKYGGKVYPLLNYYTKSGDASRNYYGIVGIRKLGKPYTITWLKERLKENQEITNYYFFDYVTSEEYGDFEEDFALSNPEIKDRIINLALENWKYEGSTYRSFNRQFLLALLDYDYEEFYKLVPDKDEYALFDINSHPLLLKWLELEDLTFQSESQIQEGISLFKKMSVEAKEYILIDFLTKVNAGEISVLSSSLLKSLAQESSSPYKMWAIAELDRHGIPEGIELLREKVNGNLKSLSSINFKSVEKDRLYDSHIYFLLWFF